MFCLFAVLSFFVGTYHEYFSDEARSWLIARDYSLHYIIFTIGHYEGHPPLWYIILKLFTLINWDYNYFFVISWLFSCLGIYIFLFKSKFHPIIKYLIPFSYFIFYQWTIIVRSYCLVSPTLGLIVVFYNKRLERPYLYCFLLAVLANIHAYSFIIANMLLCFFVFDFYIINKKLKLKDILIKSIPVFLLILYLFFIFFNCTKSPDCASQLTSSLDKTNIFIKIFGILVDTYFESTNKMSFVVYIIVILSFYFISIKTFCKNKKQILFFVSLNLAVFATILSLQYFYWHKIFILVTFLFSLWILQNVNGKTVSLLENKLFYILFSIILCIQISWNVDACISDISDSCDYSKNIADFIKEKNLTREDILAMGACAIQPYFEKNIFANVDNTYFRFSIEDIKNSKKIIREKLKTAKVLIVENLQYSYYEDMQDEILSFSDYIIEFRSNLFGKNKLIQNYYYVFLKDN